MYSESFVPDSARVRNAAVAQASEDVLGAIAQRIEPSLEQSLDRKLARARLFHDKVDETGFGVCAASADVRVTSVTFDPLQVTLDSVPGGVNAVVHVPNFRVQVNARSYCGVKYSVTGELSAKTAVIDLGLALAIDPEGNYQADVTRSAVSLNGFRFDIFGIPSIIENLIPGGVERELQARLTDEVSGQLPRLVRRALESLSKPIVRSWNGRTVTLTLTPTSIVFDDPGFTATFDGSVVAERDIATPAVPGAVFLRPPTQTFPRFANAAGFYISLNENLLNQALFASWQRGFWNIKIDQAFVQRLGVTLPFQLNSTLIAAFFPQLAGMLTPNAVVPLRLDVAPQLQPLVRVSEGPGVLTLGLGELNLEVLLDLGDGFVPVFALRTHLEAGIAPVVDGNRFGFMIFPPHRLGADVIRPTLIPLDKVDVDRFLQFVVPPAIQLAAASIRPLPLPALQGLTLVNPRVYPAGALREFLTVEGDVR